MEADRPAHRFLPLEQPARLWRASVATRFPPAPRRLRARTQDLKLINENTLFETAGH